MTEPASPRVPLARPDVIVDFDVREGLLFVSLKNIGDASAYEVTTRFDPGFMGLDGRKDIAGMNVFRRVEFMPPGKEFVQFVDPLCLYVNRHEPMRLTATMTYRDRSGDEYREVISHDLRVYLDLGHLVAPLPSSTPEP